MTPGEERKVWTGKWFQGRLNAKESKSGEVSKDERIPSESDAKFIASSADQQLEQSSMPNANEK